LIAISGYLLNDVGPGSIRIGLVVLGDLGACLTQEFLQFCFLVVGQFEISAKPLQFGGDLITFFRRQIHDRTPLFAVDEMTILGADSVVASL
jgi:hypothetical protein